MLRILLAVASVVHLLLSARPVHALSPASALSISSDSTVPSNPPAAPSGIDMLMERSTSSLRGESIDVDDYWKGARLLAHFGETRRAYDLLRESPPNRHPSAAVERFEVRLLTVSELPARADSLLALQVDTGDIKQYYAYCLQRARLNLLAGRPNRTLAFLAVVDTVSYDALAPYADFLALDALTVLHRYDDACDTGKARLAKGIPLTLSPRFEKLLFDAYLRAGRFEEARALVRVLKTRGSRMSILAPLLVGELDLMFEMGDTLQATESAVKLLKDKATSGSSLDVIQRVLKSVEIGRLSDEALVEFCGKLLRGKRLGDADRLLTELASRQLEGNDIERRRIYFADLYYKEKRYSKSYGKAQDKFEDPSLERWAMLLRARIYRKTGQAVRSAQAYSDFATRFPYDAKAAEALYVAADLFLRSADRTQSLQTLGRVIKTYPSHRYARLATLKLAGYYLDRKHYSRGVAILEESLDRSGRRNEELLYRMADAYGRMGKAERKQRLLDELAEVDPLSFYLHPSVDNAYAQPLIASSGRVALRGPGGLLEFLKLTFSHREVAYHNVRSALPPLEDGDGLLQASVVYLERGRRFLQMGFRDWAETELAMVEANRKLPAPIVFELGVLYDDYAMSWKSVRAFQRVYYALDRETRKALDGEFKLLMHPVPFPAEVLENCSRYGIAPHLVYAMIRQESRFEVRAVSRAGAMGLMQLMPATGQQVASELGFPQGVRKNLFVPEINLTFGIWYASHLLERSHDDPLMMLSAYNAGFGNARRWFGDGRDEIERVNNIDYRETRNYVKRIVESARVYHAFYFGSGPRRSAR